MTTAKKKPSLLDQISAAEDVAEELIEVPKWGVSVLFRGMTLAGYMELQESGVDLEEAANGNEEQVIRLIQVTAYDPATKELIFTGERGRAVLLQKDFNILMDLLNRGSLVVLGVDEKETAGKG